jgi:hypothetical protein
MEDMVVTLRVSNKGTVVSEVQLSNMLVMFVTELVFAPSTSTSVSWYVSKYVQSAFSYVKSHTLGLDDTCTAVPFEKYGVAVPLYFSRIVYGGNPRGL